MQCMVSYNYNFWPVPHGQRKVQGSNAIVAATSEIQLPERGELPAYSIYP
jgi:hypothetical protein